MRKTLCPRVDTDRLHMSRKEGARGLASTENCITAAI